MTEQLLIIVVLVGALALFLRGRQVTTIYPPNAGLLYRNGRFERELGPGRYAFFDPLKRTRVVQVSRAPLPATLGDFTVISSN